MAVNFVPHILTLGASKFVVRAPDEYEAISDIVGLRKITDSEQEIGAVPNSLNTLKEYGQVVSLRVGCGAAEIKGRKLKYHTIDCPVDKVVAARTTLIGKELTTQGQIQTVGFKRKRNRS